MDYIAHKRFKANGLCGAVNLPANTVCHCEGGVISHLGDEICWHKSQNAHQFFARNDDGQGMLRGKLTQSIQRTLAKRDEHYQDRWDKVWEDAICQNYKREGDDRWLWNHEFFEADILTLKHIAHLVGVKEEK